MKNIKLIHIDGKLPNLALMRLSSYFKKKNYNVDFTRSVNPTLFDKNYEYVFGSSIFQFSNQRLEKLKKNYTKALKLYRASLKFRKNLHFTFTNIATLYKEVGKNNSAIRYYHKALDIKKNYSEALFNLSILQLYFNQFQEGWCNYGKSFEINSLGKIKKYCKLPSFNSSSHKSVLVWPEQGIGDQILFSRFFNNLHNSDIKIYSSIDKKLLPLFIASLK